MGELSLEKIRSHPAFSTVIPTLEASYKGDVEVGSARDGPVSISYEIHGNGPVKTVWIMGLNGPKIAWHRQTKHFGHDNGDKYSVLILDNRGVGHSHKPVRRYSTTGMAHDLLEVLDHVGWTEERSLHVVGLSMGGMIAQELALLIPERIATLTLQSTCARLSIFSQSPARRLSLLFPKSEEKRLEGVQANIFAKSWLESPDDLGEFPTNSDRFVAEECWRADYMPPPVFMGYLLQAIAATLHNVRPNRLKQIAEKVPRILVVHGDKDEMISVKHGHDLIAGLGGESEKVKSKIFQDVGHSIHFERRDEFNKLLEEWFAGTAAL